MEGAHTRFGIIVDVSVAEQFLLDNHRDVENALEAYDAHLVEFQRATNTTLNRAPEWKDGTRWSERYYRNTKRT